MKFALPISHFVTRFLIVCVLCSLVSLAPAQQAEPAQSPSTVEIQPWQPLDITNLPLTWWDSFDVDSAELFEQRMSQFTDALQLKILDLAGEDAESASNLLQGLREQANLMTLAFEGLGPLSFDPIQTKELYTLDDLLELRGQWREVRDQQQIPRLRVEELKGRSVLLQQRQDDLLRQYEAVEETSPARILIGLDRVITRLDFQLTVKGLELQENRLTKLQEQVELLERQQDYARERLDGGETDWHAIEEARQSANAESESSILKLASLQHQLVEVLSADEPMPSLELLRRQQLTREDAAQSLALVNDSLNLSRIYWYRFRSGTLDPGFDIGAWISANEDLLEEASQQTDVWAATSQNSLISRLDVASPSARRNVYLARKAAQETLEFIDQIEGGSDDLRLVMDTLAAEMVQSDSLYESVGTRLNLVSADVWRSLRDVLDFDLFHIGDRPVTIGSIGTMILIMVIGFLISWVIRRLLARLEGLRKFAKSSVPYTMGRVLHYIIIFVSILVALGSIGLNFTNLALIASALSVGIGFGLQGIVNNFLSGLILLFEGSLRVGDFVELDSEFRGTVKEINTRATVITTNDSVDVVVPNSELVSTRLTNWTLREPVARLRIDFGVAYGSDKEVVEAAALEAASEVEFILHHTPGREAQVWLAGFGDSSLDFQLLAWVSRAGVRRPGRTRSRFLWALETKLREQGIEIPFPQRDLHLRSGFKQPETAELAQPTEDKPGKG